MKTHQKLTVKLTSNSSESEKLNSIWCEFSNRKPTSTHIISTSTKSAVKVINFVEMKKFCFFIFLICLIRAFSFFRAITSFACISSFFILQILIMLLYSFRRFVFVSFCCFFAIVCSASSFVNFLTFDSCSLLRDVIFCSKSSRRRFWWMSNSNFVRWDFVITCFVLAANSTNSFARIESLHCVRSILQIREIYSRKSSITFWQICDFISDLDKEESFEDDSFINWSRFIIWLCNIRRSSNFFKFEAADFFNWSMHLCELTDHMPNFSNANRMMISLNVCSRIWFKSSQNRFSEYCR